MAIREYKCSSCNLLTEKILPMSATPDPNLSCPRCGGDAIFLPIPTSVGLLTHNFQEQRIDVSIGNDADRRWQDVKARQDLRDKVRSKTGQSGLSMVGRNEFAPISEETKVKRTDVLSAVSDAGYKTEYDSSEDKSLVEK